MIHPEIVLEELRRFNDNSLDTQNKEIIVIVKEVIGQLISLINNEIKIYDDYAHHPTEIKKVILSQIQKEVDIKTVLASTQKEVNLYPDITKIIKNIPVEFVD